MLNTIKSHRCGLGIGG